MLDGIKNLQLPTPLLCVVSILLYLICLFVALRRHKFQKQYNQIPDRGVKIYYLIIVVFCLFYFSDTDWFHYYQEFNILKISPLYDSNFLSFFLKNGVSTLEKIYIIIAHYSLENYIIFRSIVWGGALAFIVLTVRRLHINQDAFFYIFITTFLILFAYGRVSLAFSISFYGFSFIIYKKKYSFFSIIYGLILIFFSLIFHKSILFLIPIFILSNIPFNRFSIKIILFSVIPIYLIITRIDMLLSIFPIDNTQVISTLENELENIKIKDSGSIVRLFITNYLKFLPYYIYLIGMLYLTYTRKLQKYPHYILCLISSAVWIILFSSMFLVINQYLMFYRFMIFSIIPISITLAYLYSTNLYKVKPIFSGVTKIGLFMTLFTLIYSLYLSIVL